MPEFFNVLPPAQALKVLLDRLEPRQVSPAMDVPIAEALGRVTAQAAHATEDLPSFPRSAMDGYSLRAADTFGASEGTPAYFTIAGDVPMGKPAEVSVGTSLARWNLMVGSALRRRVKTGLASPDTPRGNSALLT